MRTEPGAEAWLVAARRRRWFVDLEQGTGDAAQLDEEVRRVLALATVDIAADLTLSESREREENARAQRVLEQQNRQRQAAADRTVRLSQSADRDGWVLMFWFWSSVTLIVPWLVGFFLLKDGPFLPRASGVFDTNARNYLDYFWALYLVGFAALSIVAAAVLTLRSWRGRWGWAAIGVGLAVGSIFMVIPFGQQLWKNSEAETVETLNTGWFPFRDSYFSCGGRATVVVDSQGDEARWQVHTARRANSETSACNILYVYRGWQEVDRIGVETGREFTKGPEVNEGTTTADTVFTIETADGSTITVALADYDTGWPAP